MPTYDYQCEKCKCSFEFFQSMKDDPLKICPKEVCQKKTWGKGKVTRQLGTGAGLIFKGTGFYITDYRSENYKAAAKGDSAPSAPGAESGAAKPSSKPSEPAKASPSGKSSKSSKEA